ncbi:hypothetical protein ACS0TY_033820 [Phlomoides rotata]
MTSLVLGVGAPPQYATVSASLSSSKAYSLIHSPTFLPPSAASLSTPALQLGKSSFESVNLYLSPSSVLQYMFRDLGFSVYCGRGDKKTARGKRFNHSFGNARPKDKKKGRGPPRVPAPPLPPRKDKYDDGEVIRIEIDESFSN